MKPGPKPWLPLIRGAYRLFFPSGTTMILAVNDPIEPSGGLTSIFLEKRFLDNWYSYIEDR